MSEPITQAEDQLGDLRKLAWLFLLSAVSFFALIFNPLIFGYFDAASEAERLVHVEENLSALRVAFTAMGLAELALGIALWSWGRRVGDHTSGRRGDVARALGWIGLVAGGVALVGRLNVWLQDAGSLVSDGLGTFEIIVGSAAGLGFSLVLIGFGVLMIRGMMPAWLGVAWIACGVLFWLGILPFWFFAGGLLFGLRGLLRFRSGHSADQIAAVRTG